MLENRCIKQYLEKLRNISILLKLKREPIRRREQAHRNIQYSFCTMGLLRIYLIATIAVVTVLECSRADWAYPDIQVKEGPMDQPKVFIVRIHSENTATRSYEISGDYSNEFEIDTTSGIIFQIEPLDRETKPVYNITARSFDGNNVPTESPVSFKVIVTDINDNKPVFDESTLTGTIEEGHVTGSSSQPFMRIQATDADLGYKGDIRYSIEAGSDIPPSTSGSRFAIDDVTGNVRLIGALDYETDPEVRFTVVATDGGGLQGVATFVTKKQVVVTVTDSNDFAPVFQSFQDKALSEVSNLNTPLYNIYATDQDEGVNKKVYFEITGGNTGGTFTMISQPSDTGPSMGQLQLLKNLDFESGVTKYTLTITAYNKEASNADAYTTTAILKINVTDANEPPIFRNTPYADTITEGPAPVEPVPLQVTVLAEDIDFGGNQTVTYSLSDPENWFQVDALTGHVSLVGAVDREAQSVVNGVYLLRVMATDNYDNGPQATGGEDIAITINDINDNPPMPDWGQEGASAVVCEKPTNKTVRVITATDPDSAANGPKFTFRYDDSVDTSLWGFEEVDDESQKVVAKFSDYGLSSGSATVALKFTITDSGTIPQTGTATLTVTVCKCGDDGRATCSSATAAGFPVAIIIAIIAVILLIAILIFAVVAYKRRQDAMMLKEPFFDDEDDIHETVQVYQEECGEEDQDAYDLSALRAPLMAPQDQPVRKEVVPIQQVSRPPRGNQPDDISNIIGEAKDQADGDPSAPPFDSLLVFDYEGAGSDAGSLSSINTATTDGSMDYDYLNEWGPRFKRLADMYNDGSESE